LREIEQVLKKLPEYPLETQPPREMIFRSLRSIEPKKVKVLILGQDPYPTPGDATGHAFSIVRKGKRVPPSLSNIFRELRSDGFHVDDTKAGSLGRWVEQGVLLLNTSLTVKEGKPNSHKTFWNGFVGLVVERLGQQGIKYVALLWGSNASSYKTLIEKNGGICLTAPHPSPLSAHTGFFGCGHFKKANKILKRLGKKSIDWSLTS
jgi:uracil-DNA glycosylase